MLSLEQANNKARAFALRLLKFRPRSEAELRQRLLRKGISQATTQTLVQEFRQKGLINDAKFARYLATQRMLSRPVGRRVLLTDLKSKGIDSQLALAAVEEATKRTPELEVARGLALERIAHLKGLEPGTVKRRLFGFLSRRGFSSEVIFKVMREGGGTSPDDES